MFFQNLSYLLLSSGEEEEEEEGEEANRRAQIVFSFLWIFSFSQGIARVIDTIDTTDTIRQFFFSFFFNI